MATKTISKPKKAAKKELVIKHGDFFTGTVNKIRNVVGRISLGESLWDIYLCTNEHRLDGSSLNVNQLGYLYSWHVGKDMAKKLTIITEKQAAKLHKIPKTPLITRPKKVLSYHVDYVGDVREFGCGDVKLTTRQIEALYNLKKKPNKELLAIVSVLGDIAKEINLRSVFELPDHIFEGLLLKK